MLVQSRLHVGVLVRRVVVADEVQHFALGRLAIDLTQKAQPLGMAAALLALRDDFPIEDVEGGKQRGRAIALIACSGGERYTPTTSSTFLNKLGIARNFEAAHQMRLQSLSAPMPGYARRADAKLGSHRPRLQCVAASGLLSVVSATKRATSTSNGGAPRARSRSMPARRESWILLYFRDGSMP
jgi:hypothetical protein